MRDCSMTAQSRARKIAKLEKYTGRAVSGFIKALCLI